MSIKTLNQQQIINLLGLNLAGKGGKENEIAEALGHERNHQPLVDAQCPLSGVLYEYKKQSGCQWFDLHKLAGLTKEQKGIAVLFVVHKAGKFQGLYQTTYQGVVNAIGLKQKEWDWAKKAPAGAQVKYALKLAQIQNFTCLTKVG
tara:strand:+ start:605 stop:1042 length:438 start_codon:yes stop_codon:yes gene_type:complete